MTKDIIQNNFEEAQTLLASFISDKENFAKIEKTSKLIVKSINNGGKVISCGNGGSMSDAMHFSEELSGKFREDRPSIPAIAISDSSYITCVANDYGYEKIFSRFIEGMGNNGDVLIAISTSGNSQNVINAAKVAMQKGLKVVSLTGKDGGQLKEYSDIEIRVPYSGYADRIQEIHIKIIHSIIHSIEELIKE